MQQHDRPTLADLLVVDRDVSDGYGLGCHGPESTGPLLERCGGWRPWVRDAGDHLAIVEESGAVSFSRVATTTGTVLQMDVPTTGPVGTPAFAAAIEMMITVLRSQR